MAETVMLFKHLRLLAVKQVSLIGSGFWIEQKNCSELGKQHITVTKLNFSQLCHITCPTHFALVVAQLAFVDFQGLSQSLGCYRSHLVRTYSMFLIFIYRKLA